MSEQTREPDAWLIEWRWPDVSDYATWQRGLMCHSAESAEKQLRHHDAHEEARIVPLYRSEGHAGPADVHTSEQTRDEKLELSWEIEWLSVLRERWWQAYTAREVDDFAQAEQDIAMLDRISDRIASLRSASPSPLAEPSSLSGSDSSAGSSASLASEQRSTSTERA